MCGRYTGYIDESDELKTIYTLAKKVYPNTAFKTGEIFPTNTAPIIIQDKTALRPVPGYWGYPGFKGNDLLINARAETAYQKPTFADAFRYGRCIVPTTGYFEWDKQKTKYLFRKSEQSILYLAGLYKVYQDTVKYVILTTAANASVADVHHRMPLLLDKDDLRKWMADPAFALEYIHHDMPVLERKEA